MVCDIIKQISKKEVISLKKLYRSTQDKKLCGVCGGLAEYLDMDPTIIRLIWAILTVFAGMGILLYIISALVIPTDNHTNFTSN